MGAGKIGQDVKLTFCLKVADFSSSLNSVCTFSCHIKDCTDKMETGKIGQLFETVLSPVHRIVSLTVTLPTNVHLAALYKSC